MDALDSLSTTEFLLAIEKEFDLTIAPSETAEVLTLRDLPMLVGKKLAAPSK